MATRSFGTAVTVGGSAVGGLNSFSISGVDVNYIDTTAWDTEGGYRTFVGGLKDSGTIELGGLYDGADTGQASLRDDGGDTVAVVVTLVGGRTFSFSAVVGPFSVSGDDDGVNTFSGSLKISGAITAGGGGV